eukprot:7212373-Pyramimonas_sp.AAC.1
MFAGRPSHWLWLRLQHLDEVGGALLDLSSPTQSPVLHVQRELFELLALPPSETPLNILMYHFGKDPTRAKQAQQWILQICSSVYAQHYWRFVVPFAGQPFELLNACLSTREVLQRAVDKFWDVPTCCLEKKMSCKFRRLWDDKSAMMRDHTFWEAFRLWGHKARACNMHIERLLARIKCSVRGKAPRMERVSSSGYLAESLRLHRRSGGADPRHDKAVDLLEIGVPLESAQRESIKKLPNM